MSQHSSDPGRDRLHAALAARVGHLPVVSLGILLAAVLATGIAASLVATAAVVRAPLLPALRSE